MREWVFKDDEITLCTGFPEVFSHLLGVCVDRIEKPGEFKPQVDCPYYEINTLPPSDRLLWQFLSHALCHGVDFCSVSALRRILPDNCKQIKLPDLKNDIKHLIGEDLRDCVLIHPGAHWETKTFPESWWRGVVDLILEFKKIPVLIGKSINEEQGYVEVDERGCIDLRNMTTLEELIILISRCPLLITNDSSPIHIGGAFDNDIIAIPTVKDPEYLRPYRNKGKFIPLYGKPMWNEFSSAPTEVQGVEFEKLPGEIEQYLPSYEDLRDTIKQLIGGN
jgi:ADP-heptose:LPS heptosyltransferase